MDGLAEGVLGSFHDGLTQSRVRMHGQGDVLGVRDVHLRLADGGAWTTAADGALAIPAGTVPVRVGNCFTVDISLSGGCGDA